MSETREHKRRLNANDIEVIRIFAANNMNINATARQLYFSWPAIKRRLERIKEITGKDPRNFYDLVKLVRMLEQGGLTMNDLISKSALKEDLLARGFYPVFVKHALETAPIVDAVEVVRCRDCKYISEKPHMIRHCVITGLTPDDDDFCSTGERRADV